ncbi:MAG: cyclic pyranopterin monophosphate synthase MoaC [Candidatus Binatia bacterium]
MPELTHVDEKGRVRMVDVSAKEVTVRRAVAGASLSMGAATLERILEDDLPKGDVLAVARTAAIMAAKQTAQLIPLCHQLPLDAVTVDFSADQSDASKLDIRATVTVSARTGVEMEALVAVSVAGLTVYDMCKAIDRSMVLGEVRLVEKSGGRSGHYRRDGPT